MKPRRTWTVPAVVQQVYDGDTVHLVLDLGWHVSYAARCRIADINAPEMNTQAGVDAKAYAATLLPVGAQVTFTSHSLDKWGRPLGAITDVSGDFATKMLEAGHCVPMEG